MRRSFKQVDMAKNHKRSDIDGLVAVGLDFRLSVCLLFHFHVEELKN